VRSFVAIAVIDIGTNTVLLLVAEIDPAGKINTLEYQQRVPRLGRGVDERKMLHPDSMDRAVDVLLEYRSIMARYQLDSVAVCGTSAVRDASNRDDFAALVKTRTGFDLEILAGDEEALWTYRGAVSGVGGIKAATVVDIGGGSTELTSGTALGITRRISLNIGSVRLTERLMLHDPPLPAEIAAVRSAVRTSLHTLTPSFAVARSQLIGVAGTATTLALLAQHRTSFDIMAVSGYLLGRDAVNELVVRLQRHSSAEILREGDYMGGRNDIITAGAVILEEVMDFLRAVEITVSERGVRYGIAIREWEKMRKKN
jgi:exopolyphosphatase / guanosine-5'-triphosphate,3'-diphosphate pyrophosphatase